MARSIQDIQNEMISNVQSNAVLSGLTSPSATAIWRLWTFIFATAIHFHETFLDLGIAEMEQIARDSVPGTREWVQRRILEFQYSESVPQVVTVSADGKVGYNTIDESLRIITRCAVVEQSNGEVLIKVAKGTTTLSKLETAELDALKSYVDKIMFAGVRRRSISLDADVFTTEMSIIYDGQFVESAVRSAINTEINTYLKGLSTTARFDGLVVREHFIDAIQKVDGVVGIDTQTVVMKGQTATGNPSTIARIYNPDSGYMTYNQTGSIITLTPNGL